MDLCKSILATCLWLMLMLMLAKNQTNAAVEAATVKVILKCPTLESQVSLHGYQS